MSKLKAAWHRQHVCKSQTSLTWKIWAKMSEEQPRLESKIRCNSQKYLLRGSQAQPQQYSLSGKLRYAPSRFLLTQTVDIQAGLRFT